MKAAGFMAHASSGPAVMPAPQAGASGADFICTQTIAPGRALSNRTSTPRPLTSVKAAQPGTCANPPEHGEKRMTSVSGKQDPVVLRIGAADVIDALGKGLRDFQAMPLLGLGIGAVYAAGGILIVLCAAFFGMSYLAYPLAAGFALIAPFAAILLYEMSRRREAGQPVKLGD